MSVDTNGKSRDHKELDVSYIERFQDGDVDAFNAIYDFYKNPIYYFGLKLMQNQADAEEVVQETFLSVYKNIQMLKHPKSFHAWIFTIAYNSSQTLYRKRSRQVQLGEDTNLEEMVVVDNNQVHEVESKEVYAAIKSELNQLPEKFFEVGMLKYYVGLSVKEISYIMKIPEGTVKTRLKRVRKVIQPGLSERGYSPLSYFSFVFSPFAFQIFKELLQQKPLSPNAASQIYDSVVHVGKASIGAAVPLTVGVSKTLSNLSKAAIVGVLGLGTTTSYVVYQSLHLQDAEIIDVSYHQEPTNKKVEVKAKLKNKVDHSHIQVSKEEKAIDFEVDQDVLSFVASENGTYKIQVDKDTRNVTIDNIDIKAPEMLEIGYADGYLSLQFKDGASGIDYDTSYVLYQETRMPIPRDGKIKHDFHGEVYVAIYDVSGNMISYVVQVEQ